MTPSDHGLEPLAPIHLGAKSDRTRRLSVACATRLRGRHDEASAPPESRLATAQLIEGCARAAYLLGARMDTVATIRRSGVVSVGVQRMIRRPKSCRTDEQKRIGKAREEQMLRDRQKRRAAQERAAAEAAKAGGVRADVVKFALQAAANYRKNPGAYHYLAGGRANLECLKPTPRTWRSDCSQFGSSLQNLAGGDPLAAAGPLWVSTYSMASHLEVTARPQPGDFGMYGSRTAPHHVEVYIAQPGAEFIGHGSQPIDSVTPGRPDYYLANPLR